MPDQIDDIGSSAAADDPARGSVDHWVDRFLVQLHRQQVSPDDVRTALADVRSHCADSGQSPQEVFGDPEGYATMLADALPPAPARSVRQSTYSVVRGLALLLPITMGFAVGAVFLSAGDSTDTAVSLGQLLLVTVAVPLWAILTVPWARFRPRDPLTPQRRAFDERGWRGLWTLVGLLAVGAALWIGLDQTAFTVSKWLLFGLWAGLVATGFVLHRLLTPRVSDPRASAPTS